ncbi:glycosyltransferase family 1 protein [soil metagenome]
MTCDVLCFSETPWTDPRTRAHELMLRAADERMVFVWEPAVFHDLGSAARLDLTVVTETLVIATPRLSRRLDRAAAREAEKDLLHELVTRHSIEAPLVWLDGPRALALDLEVEPSFVVYDCTAPAGTASATAIELHILERADAVVTDSHALAERLRPLHSRVSLVPSSVDEAHFGRARHRNLLDPADQAEIRGPRIGYMGPLDRKIDVELLEAIAAARADWQIVTVGAVDDAFSFLPRTNVHHLGARAHALLPAYLAGWDVALLPHAVPVCIPGAPSMTLPYFAAGRPVVATPHPELVRAFGELEILRFAATTDSVILQIERALHDDRGPRQRRADDLLARTSWGMTWRTITNEIELIMRPQRRVSGTVLKHDLSKSEARAEAK